MEKARNCEETYLFPLPSPGKSELLGFYSVYVPELLKEAGVKELVELQASIAASLQTICKPFTQKRHPVAFPHRSSKFAHD